MNLLIVDDEVLVIRGLMETIAWEELNFENIFSANSYMQAIEQVEKDKVDVLLCDIEMPHGSGLDLIDWMNVHSPNTISIILSFHDEFHFAKQAISLKCFEYLLKPVTPRELIQVLKRAISQVESKLEDEKYRDYGKSYVKNIGVDVEDDKDVDAVEKVQNYIKQHVNEELSVEKLATLVYLSPDYLTRIFKKRFGKSVIDYLAEYRIGLAAQLLLDTELSVTMIAAKVGYGNYSYFTKQFRKFYLITPREYREKYKRTKLP